MRFEQRSVQVLGLYVLLADDDEDGYESNAEWRQDPELFQWQQDAANVLFFTFIHPDTMDVPPAFQKLAATRGSGAPGSVPANTVIMFAIGGYAYSLKPNPWHWLTSRAAAEEMAEKVARWPEQYGCDGIDLDLEEGAGGKAAAGPNMVHFVRKLKELNPSMIVSQPTYGWPQVKAEIDVINASWERLLGLRWSQAGRGGLHRADGVRGHQLPQLREELRQLQAVAGSPHLRRRPQQRHPAGRQGRHLQLGHPAAGSPFPLGVSLFKRDIKQHAAQGVRVQGIVLS